MPSFDAIIIGTGQAGPSLAHRLADAGQRVAILERHRFGGTCINTGCTPTKTLVASAYAAHLARRATDYGLIVPEVGVDFAKVHARAHQVTLNARANNEKWLGGMERLTLYREHARFEGPNLVRVGDELITAPRIFINVGGRANVPDFPGVHDVPFLNNSSVLDLDELPKHLIVVGGSYIGLEFGQIFRRLGAEVTIVEKAERLIGREDAVISDAIREILEDEGIAIRTHAECISLKAHPDGPAVDLN